MKAIEDFNELNEISLDAEIPKGISLVRIKRKVFAQIQPKRAPFQLKAAVVVPVIILVMLCSFTVYAYTSNLWGLFFKTPEISLETNEAFTPVSITDNGYTVTLNRAYMGKSYGILILSLQNADHTEFDGYPSINLRIPLTGYGSMGYSSSSLLSEDRKTMYYCYLLNGSNSFTSPELKLDISGIEKYENRTLDSEIPLEAILNGKYPDVLSAPVDIPPDTYAISSSRFNELNDQVNSSGDQVCIYRNDDCEIYLISAGFINDELCYITHIKRDMSHETVPAVYPIGLTDSRTDEYIVPDWKVILGRSDESGIYEKLVYENFTEEDLQFLFPKFRYFKSIGSVDGNWNLSARISKTLEEMSITDRMDFSAFPGINPDSIVISSIGAFVSVSGESNRAYSDFILKTRPESKQANSYFLMEDGSKLLLKNTADAVGGTDEDFHAEIIFSIWEEPEAVLDDRLLLCDIHSIKALYINDVPVWKRK